MITEVCDKSHSMAVYSQFDTNVHMYLEYPIVLNIYMMSVNWWE